MENTESNSMIRVGGVIDMKTEELKAILIAIILPSTEGVKLETSNIKIGETDSVQVSQRVVPLDERIKEAALIADQIIEATHPKA